MPVVNQLARELVFKVVYYGPGLGGKTTSLQYIHATAKPEHRGKMVSLATPVDRTLYFDFLPIRVPSVRGMSVRVQLFTVPGQVYYNATRKLVLTGADGVVLVFDSQRARNDANLESLENLMENLRAHGRDLADVPHVIQYNKRDLYDVASVDELEQQLNRFRAPSFATTATNGEGIYVALESITRAILEDFARRMPDMRGLPTASLELPEGGLVDALRRAENEESGEAPKRPASSSGEYRLSRFPELDPGEAAARAVSGQVEDVLPRSRQTWPLPGAPDAARQHYLSVPSQPVPPRIPVVETPVEALATEPSNSRPEKERPATEGAAQAELETVSAELPIREEPDLSPASMREPDPAPRSHPPSQLPEVPIATTLSFEQLWPQSERATVRELEAAFVAMNYTRAISLSEQLVARSLAGAAAALGGTPDAPRDPLTVVLVLGIDRRRYLEYRGFVRDARSGRTMSASEALVAYAIAIETRLARLSLAG
ncbi:MAG TPA: gliding motility protein [Polyangiaceae bacterium]|nr:gliding motility protein [Polyangiaceae bacterium]